LANGSTYSFQVRACNTYCGQWSASSNQVVPFGPPPAPIVSASPGGPKTINFSWTQGENGRRVTRFEYSVDGGPVAGTTGMSASVTGVYNQSHSIRVWAFDETGQAGSQGAASANTPTASVAVSQGAKQQRTFCASSSCAYIVVTVNGLAPGTYNVQFDTNAPGGAPLVATTISVNSSGYGRVEGPNVYGYPNTYVAASVDGLWSPQYTWPNN
jgi:hypothetical protein